MQAGDILLEIYTLYDRYKLQTLKSLGANEIALSLIRNVRRLIAHGDHQFLLPALAVACSLRREELRGDLVQMAADFTITDEAILSIPRLFRGKDEYVVLQLAERMAIYGDGHFLAECLASFIQFPDTQLSDHVAAMIPRLGNFTDRVLPHLLNRAMCCNQTDQVRIGAILVIGYAGELATSALGELIELHSDSIGRIRQTALAVTQEWRSRKLVP